MYAICFDAQTIKKGKNHGSTPKEGSSDRNQKLMIIVWFQVKVIVGRNSLSLGTDISFWNSLLDPTRLSNMW